MPSLPRSHNIVGRWVPSAGATGFRLIDRVRSNHGTLTNMDPGSDWVASGGKGALSFSTDDFVNFGNAPVVSSGLPFFVSAWFRTTSSSVQVIVAKSRAATATHRFWLTLGEGSGDVRVNGADAGGSGVSASFTTTFADGNWHQMAGLFSGSTMSLFYDGQFRASAAILQLEPSQNTLVVGKYNDASGGVTGNTAPFEGQIDDITLFNTALTANEVREIYRLGRGYGVFPEPDFDEGFAAAGFKAYWARRQSQLIGGGV